MRIMITSCKNVLCHNSSLRIRICITYSFLLVAYRMYNYSIFAATSVGEGPSADGSFLTREDSEFIGTIIHYNDCMSEYIVAICP